MTGFSSPPAPPRPSPQQLNLVNLTAAGLGDRAGMPPPPPPVASCSRNHRQPSARQKTHRMPKARRETDPHKERHGTHGVGVGERSPGTQKPRLTSGPVRLSNFKTGKPLEYGTTRKGTGEAENDVQVRAHRATPHIPAEGPALSVCRAALQRRGRTDPNEITVFKMSIN